jgi:phosphoribosylaminoimidazolecarboxamide formyltransferase/IMP cyclohydrolase
MNIKRALISVSDKDGIIKFTNGLKKLNIDIISTGGTGKFLKKFNIKIKEVSELTNFPEILDGRVKTLHPVIHAGILAMRNNRKHMDVINRFKIKPIDIVICNLYPFEKTIKKDNVNWQEVIENIDIGGPTLIRAAAKNYKDVIVATNKNQYESILESLKIKGNLYIKEREQLAIEAFTHTAIYDSIISNYLREKLNNHILPNNNVIALKKLLSLRYGENPHQKGIYYKSIPEILEPCISNSVKIHGKDLSYNNILDSDCAIECIKEFNDPTCVIIKHATPCGIASHQNLLKAWYYAYATDTYSPFGGIVAFNREVNGDIGKDLSKIFLEVIIAPSFSKDALKILCEKKNLRLIILKNLDKKINRKGFVMRSVVGGFLSQERDIKKINKDDWIIVTKKIPTKNELISMEFAVKCVKHIRSNSVVFVKDTKTVAIGGGQTARVDAAWIATQKGKENIKNSIMASDAFFPFRDGIDVAAEAGVKAIIQPGGSIRDDEVINAADEHDISMVFSGQRYFRH